MKEEKTTLLFRYFLLTKTQKIFFCKSQEMNEKSFERIFVWNQKQSAWGLFFLAHILFRWFKLKKSDEFFAQLLFLLISLLKVLFCKNIQFSAKFFIYKQNWASKVFNNVQLFLCNFWTLSVSLTVMGRYYLSVGFLAATSKLHFENFYRWPSFFVFDAFENTPSKCQKASTHLKKYGTPAYDLFLEFFCLLFILVLDICLGF